MRRFGYEMNILQSIGPTVLKYLDLFNLQDDWKPLFPQDIVVQICD